MKNNNSTPNGDLPLFVLRFACTQSTSTGIWEMHGLVANKYPALLRYDFLDHHMFVLPIGSKEEANAARSFVEQEFSRLGSDLWFPSGESSSAVLHFHSQRHDRSGTVDLIGYDQLDDVIAKIQAIVGPAAGCTGYAYPLAEDGESSLTDDYEAVSFVEAKAKDVDVLQALARKLVVDAPRIMLQRVLITCGERGVWVGTPAHTACEERRLDPSVRIEVTA